jgi:hypothetical protein
MSTSEGGREVRSTQLALGAALGIGVAILGFALWLRYGPPRERAGDQAARAAETSAGEEFNVMTAAASPPDTLHPPDSGGRVEPSAAPAVATDLVLLPCNEPNPRPDGRFLIPPHDPTHRTIVGLPSGPGAPRQGFVIPPHDPAVENRVKLEVVPLDSLLETTIRIPAHDPTRFKLVGPDSLPCIRG